LTVLYGHSGAVLGSPFLPASRASWRGERGNQLAIKHTDIRPFTISPQRSFLILANRSQMGGLMAAAGPGTWRRDQGSVMVGPLLAGRARNIHSSRRPERADPTLARFGLRPRGRPVTLFPSILGAMFQVAGPFREAACLNPACDRSHACPPGVHSPVAERTQQAA